MVFLNGEHSRHVLDKNSPCLVANTVDDLAVLYQKCRVTGNKGLGTTLGLVEFDNGMTRDSV